MKLATIASSGIRATAAPPFAFQAGAMARYAPDGDRAMRA